MNNYLLVTNELGEFLIPFDGLTTNEYDPIDIMGTIWTYHIKDKNSYYVIDYSTNIVTIKRVEDGKVIFKYNALKIK